MGIYNPGSGGSSPGGVTQIVAGTGISVNNGGVGVVTVTNTIPAGLTTLPTNNVVYVMKNGNDGTGTRNRLDKPFLTIGAAAAALVAGDTLWVFPGTYLPTTTINITNCNIYLQDAIVDYGTNAGPLFNLTANASFGAPAHKVIYGTGGLFGSPASGTSLIQTSSNDATNASRYVFLKEVGRTRTVTASAACPIFSVIGNLSVEIYKKSEWNSFPSTNGLFQFGSTSASNKFLFKAPSYTKLTPNKLNSNFKGTAQIQVDNAFTDGAMFEFANGATGTIVIRETSHQNDPGSSGGSLIYIESGSLPTVILWNTICYLRAGNFSITADDPNTPVYFYGINQSNKPTGNILEMVGTMTVDSNLIYPILF